MRNFHENVMKAVLKHTKEVALIDAWFQGIVVCKFAIGSKVGTYVGNQMMRLDTGGIIDFDPSRITGVLFERIIREDDAEMAFKELTEKNKMLEAQINALNDEAQANQMETKDLLETVVTSRNLEMERDVSEGLEAETVKAAGLTPDSTNPDVPASKDPLNLDK